MKVILLAVLLSCSSAFGQDDAGMAAAQQAFQQAQQQAQQFEQQAQDYATQASQQAAQQAQQDMQSAQLNSAPVIAVTATPTFSVKAGELAPGTTVRITSRTHYAVIYYTTNEWAPTTNSRRFKGPIPIHANAQLQAIAVAPNMRPSMIASAKYTVKGVQVPTQPLILSADGILHAGTRLHLVTGSAVNSKTAQVGDHLNLLLDQDLMLDDAVLVPKGTAVEATITQADPAARAGVGGDVAFEVYSLTINGKEISLKGGETLQGANHYLKAYVLIPFIGPMIGLAKLTQRGDEAQITPGMTLTAAVTADTALQP
jgi:hypothetical protein